MRKTGDHSRDAENKENINFLTLLTNATSGWKIATMPHSNGLAKGRNLEKRREAIALWLKGLTYAEIGKALNFSRQRAQQMISPPRSIWIAIRAKAKGKCQECGVEILGGHIHHKSAVGRTIDDFNDLVNLVYLCPGCHRRAHCDLGATADMKTISLRPTDDDRRIIEYLQRKLKLKTTKILRLAIKHYAKVEGLRAS